MKFLVSPRNLNSLVSRLIDPGCRECVPRDSSLVNRREYKLINLLCAGLLDEPIVNLPIFNCFKRDMRDAGMKIKTIRSTYLNPRLTFLNTHIYHVYV